MTITLRGELFLPNFSIDELNDLYQKEGVQKAKIRLNRSKKKRKRIAVDEKEIKINGTTIFIQVAVDLDEKIIATWVSFGRSGLEAKSFLKKVKSACIGRLPRIFIDGGSWYPWALNEVGFPRYTVITFGPRSAIERLFGILNGE